MQTITIAIIIILIIIGLFHIYWAIGGTVGLDKALPTKNGTLLIKPSKILTLIIGISLIIFATIAYLLQYSNVNSSYLINSGWILSFIFIIRSIGEFNTVGFFKKIKNTTFAKYDTKYFSPISMSLGIVFAILSYK